MSLLEYLTTKELQHYTSQLMPPGLFAFAYLVGLVFCDTVYEWVMDTDMHLSLICLKTSV